MADPALRFASWPGFARDKVWKAMLDLGVDWINADNLKAASEV